MNKFPEDVHDVFFNDFKSYWPSGTDAVRALPLRRASLPDTEPIPPRMVMIILPEWAADLGADGAILVPEHLVPGGDRWDAVDWALVAFWYVHGLAEREFERKHGPIHSYSFRLKGWDERMWSRAWANRIALFLRRWAARNLKKDENALFGPLPEPEIILTHDVDAIRKTVPIRIKHAAFLAFNAFRRGGNSGTRLYAALKYFLRNDDYWCFDRICDMESRHGVKSWFLVYGGRGGMRRRPKDILFDPGYAVEEAGLSRQITQLKNSGHTIGLHQAFGSWTDQERMLAEKRRLEGVLNEPVSVCRQHWLRFSWQQTWAAQAEAGLKLDCTLGFNDRPGFRNGAALRHKPLAPDLGSRLGIESLPMVVMDSHFYSYAELCENAISSRLRHWAGEIMAVRGQGTIIWHQHSFSRDFGWRGGYETLLTILSGLGGVEKKAVE